MKSHVMNPTSSVLLTLVGSIYVAVAMMNSFYAQALVLTLFEPLLLFGLISLIAASGRKALVIVGGYWSLVGGAVWLSIDVHVMLGSSVGDDAGFRLGWLSIPIANIVFGFYLFWSCGRVDPPTSQSATG